MKTILGLTEKIILIDHNGKEKELTARIDTGATSSSLDLNLSKEFHLGPEIKTRVVKSASGISKRPIILATVKIKDITIEGEFTLADRSYMTYDILIGQNILKKGNFLIDPKK